MKAAVLNYFDKARSYYMTAFGVYLAVTIVGSAILGSYSYRYSRKMLLEMQNMLILLPLDLLSIE